MTITLQERLRQHTSRFSSRELANTLLVVRTLELREIWWCLLEEYLLNTPKHPDGVRGDGWGTARESSTNGVGNVKMDSGQVVCFQVFDIYDA